MQNDAPFVAFYDMRAVTFVLPDEMADVSIAGLQWFILKPPIKPHIPSPIYWYIKKNHIEFGPRTTQPAAILRLRGKQPFVSDFSCLLRHTIVKGRGLILFSKNTPGPHGECNKKHRYVIATRKTMVVM